MGLLLDKGLAVDHVLGDTGQRLITRACYRGSKRVAQVLIQRNANRFRMENEDESPLHIACKRGHKEIVKLLITGNLYFEPIKDGRAPEHFEQQVNARDKYGRTALHQAAFGGHNFLVYQLINLGADIEIRDYAHGSTALHYAAVSSKESGGAVIIDILIRTLDAGVRYSFLTQRTFHGDTAIHWAADGGWLNAVSALAAIGSPTDIGNFDGETPLMQAAANGHVDVVTHLIDCYRGPGVAKEYVNQEDGEGMTALDHSAMFDHSEVAVILIERGANLTHRDFLGETCLHKASRNGYKNVVKSILEAMNPAEQAALAKITDHFGVTAFDLALKCNEKEVMEFLVPFRRNLANDLCPQELANDVDNQATIRDSEAEEFGEMTLQLAAGRGLNDLVIKMIEAQGEKERIRYVNSRDENGNTALHWAASKERPEMIDILIDAGARVDSFNHYHETPLILASIKGNLDVIKNIIECFDSKDVVLDGSKRNLINSREHGGWTALHHLSSEGHTEALSYLIEQGGDIRARDSKFGSTPLHFGAEEGHSAVVNALINACPVPERENYVNLSNKFGQTALLLAAADKCVDSVDLLVRAGSDRSHTTVRGYSPLMTAAECGHQEIVKYLLETFDGQADEETNAIYSDDRCVLDTPKACAKSAYICLKNEDGLTALHLAASEGHKDCVAILLDHGASLRIRGGIADSTPLHLASEAGNCDLLRALLEAIPEEEKSIFVNAVDSDGNTALHLAACQDSVEVASLLIQYGISVYLENGDRETPFSLAARYGQLDVVKYILDVCIGAQTKAGDGNERRGRPKDAATIEYINKGNYFSKTALRHAVYKEHTDVVKFLIDNGAEINTLSLRFTWLLQKAAKNGDADTIKVLLDAVEDKDFSGTSFDKDDFDIDTLGYYRQTALYLAAEAGSLESVDYLVKAGANVTLGDSFRQTPLMVASWYGNLEVVKYLLDNCEEGKNGIVKREYIILQDVFGKTAITFAEQESRSEVIAFLTRML